MRLETAGQIVEEVLHTKFHGNPSIGSRVRCGQMDGETDTTKVIIAVRNFEKAPKWDEQDYSNTFTAMKFVLLTF
jgi:hypothetical protein